MKILTFGDLPLVGTDKKNITLNANLEYGSGLQQLNQLDGAFDTHGDRQFREPLTFEYQLLVVGANFADVDLKIDEIKKVASLGRQRLQFQMRDLTVRSTLAKLFSVRDQRIPDNHIAARLFLSFEVSWPFLQAETDIWWLDTGKSLDAGLFLDRLTAFSAGGSFLLNNTGGDRVTTGTITIKGAATNPLVSNTTTGEQVGFFGSLAVGESLFIDFGARTAIVNGKNVWGNIVLGANHNNWFSLAIGINTLGSFNNGSMSLSWARVY